MRGLLSFLAGLVVLLGVRAGMPDVDAIALAGTYDGHLQDVWFDGTSLYWAHTADIVRTDLQGNVLARARVAAYHHAGLEVRGGRLYTAVCLQNDMATVGTKGNSHVIVAEYDAATLAPVAVHETDVEDRAGSLAILDDGSFLVGCLRQNDLGVDQVRYHHLAPDFTCLGSTCVDELPVMMGIEVLRVRGPFRYLCMSGVDAAGKNLGYDTVKVDERGREVWRGTLGGCWGLIFDGACIWVGETACDRTTGKWSSRLVRKGNDLPASVSVTPRLVHGRVRALDVAVDALAAPRALYLATGQVDVGGGTTNGWTRVTRVGTVPAGATRVEDLPVADGDSPLARVFLGPVPEAGSEAYVGGLIAQWDGIDNAGRGVHDAGAACPVELVHGGAQTVTGTVPAGARHFALGRGDLRFENAAIVNACNAGSGTVEMCVTANAAPVRNGGLVAFGDGARALWVYEGDACLVGDMTYHGLVSGDFQTVRKPSVTAPRAETNLLSFVLGGTTGASRMLVDGVSVGALKRFGTAAPDAVCRIGSLGNRWAGTRAPVDMFSLRVYDRALSRAEVAHNHRVDAMRFRNAPAFEASAAVCVRAVDSSAYVQAGLVAQWDGRDNAGRGLHDATAACPVELVRGCAMTATGTVPAAKDHFRLGDGYLTFSAPEIVAACNAGAATVEILLAPDGEPVHNGGLVAFGDTSRAFWIYERSFGGQRHLIGDVTYHGALAGDFQGLNIPWDGTGTNLCTFVLATGSASQARRDGMHVAALNRFKTDCGDVVCRIGSLGGQWSGIRGRAKVFSIRVYNRILTPAERAQNFAVDRMRFLIPADARTVVTVR